MELRPRPEGEGSGDLMGEGRGEGDELESRYADEWMVAAEVPRHEAAAACCGGLWDAKTGPENLALPFLLLLIFLFHLVPLFLS